MRPLAGLHFCRSVIQAVGVWKVAVSLAVALCTLTSKVCNLGSSLRTGSGTLACTPRCHSYWTPCVRKLLLSGQSCLPCKALQSTEEPHCCWAHSYHTAGARWLHSAGGRHNTHVHAHSGSSDSGDEEEPPVDAGGALLAQLAQPRSLPWQLMVRLGRVAGIAK
jgi:hypothetical protein